MQPIRYDGEVTSTKLLGRFKSPLEVGRKLPPTHPFVTRTHDPLRILVFGCDLLSNAVFKSLIKEKKRNPKLIAAVSAVCLKGQTESGDLLVQNEWQRLKDSTERHSVPFHHVDSLETWEPPMNKDGLPDFNFIVIASFNGRVPNRLIEMAKYHAVNVHTSWLPE